MIVFVHISTSDLLKKALPLTDPSQPWCCGVAAELAAMDGEPVNHINTIVRPAAGRKVREEAAARHGITTRDSEKYGISEIVALGNLCEYARKASYVVGHGIEFDRKIVESVLLRAGKDTRLWTRPGLEFLDTMTTATPFCRIPPKEPREDSQWKWPSLDEACSTLLGESPREGVHHPWESLQRTKRLFLHLASQNAYELAA